jgi:hypothetical protein
MVERKKTGLAKSRKAVRLLFLHNFTLLPHFSFDLYLCILTLVFFSRSTPGSSVNLSQSGRPSFSRIDTSRVPN